MYLRDSSDVLEPSIMLQFAKKSSGDIFPSIACAVLNVSMSISGSQKFLRKYCRSCPVFFTER